MDITDEPASGDTSVTLPRLLCPGALPGLLFSQQVCLTWAWAWGSAPGPQKQPSAYAEGGEEQSPTRKAVWLKR